MSKIFEAYKKRARGAPDLEQEIARSATMALYSTPPTRQRAEFDDLANSLLRLQKSDEGLSLAFASSVPGEGTSFISYQVAVQLALNFRKRVVWIDGNFRSPQRKLGSADLLSYADLLQEPDRLGELTSEANPVFLRGGDLARQMGLFAADSYRRVVARLRETFDFAILDLPPFLESTETAIMAVPLDGLLVVVESRRLKWEVIQHGISSLQEKHVPVLGTVINRRRYELPKIIYDRL
jgi:Mrp family chromosome partitioning ATPase